ncbi:cation diffusion facilitator family transporter [Patescibacteria group bacterium]|nr:cation diffusion facilitator family transporter [Patescibacteria group bacterium]MBU1673088.1 cation diffusion facilitator family transporter [Patescibacteria group bacterium]MBU1963694.1 cation diffusion facilitator family transporter [Patescibacteria group bacterium]
MTKARGLSIAILLTSIILFVEIVGAFFSNSLALLSDAGHMLVDFLALVMALVAVQIAKRPATAEKTFGYLRWEVIAALFNGILLVLVSVYIFYEAIQRLFAPEPVAGGLTLIVAIVGLIANAVAMLVLGKTGVKSHAGHSHEDINIKGAFWHVLSDALTSLGVIIAAIIILATGWMYIDPIISIVIALFVVRGAVKLIMDSTQILTESTPKDVDLEKVREKINEHKMVRCVHDLHVWTITSGKYAMAGHVQINDCKISESDKIYEELRKMLEKEFDIQHPTIQFEYKKCHGSECSLCKIK